MNKITTIILVVLLFVGCSSSSTPQTLLLEITELNNQIRTNDNLNRDDWLHYDARVRDLKQKFRELKQDNPGQHYPEVEQQFGKFYALKSTYESKLLRGKVEDYLEGVKGFLDEVAH